MRTSLYLKFLVSYIILGIGCFIVLFTFTENQTSKYLTKEESEKLYHEAVLISSNCVKDYSSGNTSLDTLQDQIETIALYLDAQISIVDSNGRYILMSDRPAISTTNTKIYNFDISEFGSNYYMVGNLFNEFDEDNLTVFASTTNGFKVTGYVLINKPVSKITEGANGYVDVAFYTVAICYILAFIILLAFTFVVYLPVRKITKAANEYAKGNFDKTIDVHSSDEIGYLAATLNYMAKELGSMEEDQRKFVSNVSHDFRSPLTSIKGYVEAMIDGTIPVELQGKYLNIILFESERLTKLTQSLLELGKFGQHGIRLDISDFDINELIRSTLPTFEGKCAAKNVNFNLVLTGENLFVTADPAKIQQVLYNLIDNAVKFSNNNSSIKIETSLKNEKAFISVKDSGVGIPADSIKKIWDRFYKTDQSRGKDKRGTGLGLAIVKEIMTSHGENINVISTEDVGTEFVFTLKLAKQELERPIHN